MLVYWGKSDKFSISEVGRDIPGRPGHNHVSSLLHHQMIFLPKTPRATYGEGMGLTMLHKECKITCTQLFCSQAFASSPLISPSSDLHPAVSEMGLEDIWKQPPTDKPAKHSSFNAFCQLRRRVQRIQEGLSRIEIQISGARDNYL